MYVTHVCDTRMWTTYMSHVCEYVTHVCAYVTQVCAYVTWSLTPLLSEDPKWLEKSDSLESVCMEDKEKQVANGKWNF